MVFGGEVDARVDSLAGEVVQGADVRAGDEVLRAAVGYLSIVECYVSGKVADVLHARSDNAGTKPADTVGGGAEVTSDNSEPDVGDALAAAQDAVALGTTEIDDLERV